MKKISLIAAALLLARVAPSLAQGEKFEKTPGLEKMQSGFVAAPDFKFSELDSEPASLLGGYAGWLTDRKLFLGAGAYFLTSGPSGADLAYGGALVEWFAQRNDRFNLSFRGLVGAGSGSLAADVDDFPQPSMNRRGALGGRDGHFPPFPHPVRIDEGFFVAEPQANASYNFTGWLRLGAGAGYRFIGAASGLESRFRGPTASVFLQFGSLY